MALEPLTKQTNWLGGISATKMVHDGVTTVDAISVAAGTLKSYFIKADLSCDVRCIDGRCSGMEDAAHLGPQLPGGTPGSGLAYRLGVIRDHLELGKFCDDAQYMLAAFERAGIKPGDHRDDHGHGVGCGAIDKMDLALKAMVDSSLVRDHERLVRLLLGDTFNEEMYLHVMGAAVMIEGRADEYFEGRDKSVEMLEERIHHKVPVLHGEHQECFVIINLVEDTTFDNKRFAEDYHGMQAFNYDFWQTLKGADAIFGKGTRERDLFVTARAMTAVATLMVLTDGTQRLIVRSSA